MVLQSPSSEVKMKTAVEKAEAVCQKYMAEVVLASYQGALLGRATEDFVQKTAAFVNEWPKALPLRGIIIGQYPSAADVLSAPPLAASFSYEGDRRPAVVGTMVHEMMLSVGPEATAFGEEALTQAIRNGWKLIDEGVLSVHSLPFGPVDGYYTAPKSRKPADTLRIEKLASTLARLIALSSTKVQRPPGVVTVVTLGKWAELVGDRIVKELQTMRHKLSNGWVVQLNKLYHPGYIWHTYKKTRLSTVILGGEAELQALYRLFTGSRAKKRHPPRPRAPGAPERSRPQLVQAGANSVGPGQSVRIAAPSEELVPTPSNLIHPLECETRLSVSSTSCRSPPEPSGESASSSSFRGESLNECRPATSLPTSVEETSALLSEESQHSQPESRSLLGALRRWKIW